MKEQKEEPNNEKDLYESPNIVIYEPEQNDDSKSLILAPYNSYDSLNNSLKEEIDDLTEITIMNDVCEFEPQAQIANLKYEESNHN